jgi:hypothetical protein
MNQKMLSGSYNCFSVGLAARRRSSPHIIELVISAYSYFRFPVLCTNIIVVGDLSMTLFNDVFMIVLLAKCPRSSALNLPTFVHRYFTKLKLAHVIC